MFDNNGRSIFIGKDAGNNDDHTLNMNVFVGYYSGRRNTSGHYNTAVGYEALKNNLIQCFNTEVGTFSQYSNQAGGRSFLGTFSLYLNTTGHQNNAVGYGALYSNTTGFSNNAFGLSSLYNNINGNYNISLGGYAMMNNQSGGKNIAIGAHALNNQASGNNNIAIGFEAGRNMTTGSNNIMLGHNVFAPDDACNNQLNIGNLIFANGVDGEDSTLSSGNVGIGVKNPTAKFEVNGQVKILGGLPGTGKYLVSDANGLASWALIATTVLYDADSNTLIQVEKNSNEDKVRFDLGGIEYLVLDHRLLKQVIIITLQR